MTTVILAVMTGLRAPWRRWRLVLVLWLARLLPIGLAFGLPLFLEIKARSAHHPDARLLLDPARDATGFAWSWSADFFRQGFVGASDTLFWIALFAWLLVTSLTGGILVRLVRGAGSGPFLAECGRYGGRFLRLALIAAFVFYCADVACNALLAEFHTEAGRLHQTQDFELEKSWIRGTLFLAIAYLLGIVHSYARIDIVVNERRSALLSYLRGVGILVTRLPALFLVESAMLLYAGLAALVAWFFLKIANPLHPGATSIAISSFLLLALIGSYFRSGVEIGAMDARCRLLAPDPVITVAPLDPRVSPIETPIAQVGEEPEDLSLPPEPAP
ncbi:MAG: hypothetical protein ACYTGV_01610 [Planctomycetota bacterium]